MSEKKNKIAKLLWDFNSLREDHIMKICGCSKDDIDYLITKKVLERVKNTGIVRHRSKEVNNRNVVAFDVVMEYLERDPKIEKAKFPVNVTLKTQYTTYDIIAIKEQEVENLYENIDTISTADKIIIIIETNNYIKRNINTNRECYICTYPPLEIVDKLN